jgi:hypothetical protein
MNSFSLLAKSRTVWTAFLMYAITYGPIVSTMVPDQWKPFIDAVLTLLVFYFHVNPRQNYGTPTK